MLTTDDTSVPFTCIVPPVCVYDVVATSEPVAPIVTAPAFATDADDPKFTVPLSISVPFAVIFRNGFALKFVPAGSGAPTLACPPETVPPLPTTNEFVL